MMNYFAVVLLLLQIISKLSNANEDSNMIFKNPPKILILNLFNNTEDNRSVKVFIKNTNSDARNESPCTTTDKNSILYFFLCKQKKFELSDLNVLISNHGSNCPNSDKKKIKNMLIMKPPRFLTDTSLILHTLKKGFEREIYYHENTAIVFDTMKKSGNIIEKHCEIIKIKHDLLKIMLIKSRYNSLFEQVSYEKIVDLLYTCSNMKTIGLLIKDEEKSEELFINGTIFPGTKWCGDGFTARSFAHKGELESLDRCCRAQAICPSRDINSSSLLQKTNNACDEAFKKCLDNLNTIEAEAVKLLHFKNKLILSNDVSFTSPSIYNPSEIKLVQSVFHNIENSDKRSIYYCERTLVIIDENTKTGKKHCEIIPGNKYLLGKIVYESLPEIQPKKVAFGAIMELINSCSQPEYNIDDQEQSLTYKYEQNVDNNDTTIFPSTLWCGKGSKALNYHQLGSEEADKCCRAHDMCPIYILPGETRYGVTNNGTYILSHCECDRALKKCLDDTEGMFVVPMIKYVYSKTIEGCIDTNGTTESSIKNAFAD